MPFFEDGGPRLRPEEFRLIRELVNRFCGIDLSEEMSFVVERRLRERIATLRLGSFEDYYRYLRYHADAAAEVERAIDVLTTNETYFFREDYQLRAFRDEVMPRVRERAIARASKRVGIWSAGCSTGEEVYTLAMLLAETGLYDDWDVRIFGNDISRRVLNTARRATYGRSSFRVMPPEYMRYFEESPEGLRVNGRIRAMCHFAQINLLDRSRAAVVGNIDAIFCRNVLIYFDEDSRRKVIETFYDRLEPGGYLMLGHSESLLHVSTAFELVHLKSDLVYRRPMIGLDRPRPSGGKP